MYGMTTEAPPHNSEFTAASRRDQTAFVPRQQETAPIDAGAVGLSTSFVDVDDSGRPVPSRFAPFSELDALAAVMGERMLAHCMLPTTRYQPDLDALRAAPTRIVVGVGKATQGILPYRTAVTLAGRLRMEADDFPGGHGGFAEVPGPWAETLDALLSW